jgi:hypothetical protein
MKFMILFLIAALPVASVAQAQSGQAQGASGLALPKTTGVMVILTAKQGRHFSNVTRCSRRCPVHKIADGSLVDCQGWRKWSGSIGWENTCFNLDWRFGLPLRD